jgi:ubiquinone biosynthesis protein UbiJ
VAEARSAHAVVAGWEEPPRALPVWLETSQALIDAVEALAEASLAGDADAVDAAAAAYRAASERARQADTALAISIAEAGSAVAAIPLGRLAAMTAQVADLRDEVASVLLGLDPVRAS